MITSLQTVSNANVTATINPLHLWGSLPQATQMQISSLVNPSSITTLGTTSSAVPLTYNATGLLQTLSPTISASGLNAAQQHDLAVALGLKANATSSDVTNAINALLTPADASQALVDVLVGDINAAATESSATTPSLSDIPGFFDIPNTTQNPSAETASQVSDAVFAATIDLGVAATTTNAASIQVSGNLPAASLNSAIAGNTVTTEPPVAAANLTAAEVAATATANTTAATLSAPITIATQAPAVTTTDIATATSVTTAPPATAVAAAATVATTDTTATVAATATTAAATTATATTIAATATATTAEFVAATKAAQNLLIENVAPAPVNIAVAAVNVTAVQGAPVAAITPAATELATAAEAAVPAAIAPIEAGAVPAAVATANTIPIISFDNASSVLQILLAEAAAHAMIQNNPASATYSVGGALFQMGTGADHAQQLAARSRPPDIRDMTRPISRSAGIRGSSER